MDKVRIFGIVCQFSIGGIILGTMFRIMHWPLGSPLLVFGSVALAIFSILYFVNKPEKSLLDRISLVLVPAWCVHSVAKNLDFPYRPELGLGLLVVAMIYSVYVVIKMNKEDKSRGESTINWERVLFVVGMCAIFTGIILKYNYLPYARHFLIVGVVISILSYFLGFFSKEEEVNQDELEQE